MEPEPRHRDNDYLYRDYYSTDGCYRPPRHRGNHGWILAVLGAFLLCAAAGLAMSRERVSEVLTPEPSAAVLMEEAAVGMETAAPVETADASVRMGTMEEIESAVESAPARDGSVQMDISDTGGRELALPDLYQKIIPSVVSITALSSRTKSTGTGIIMREDGYLITNYHVVAGAENISVLLFSGEEMLAVWVGGDETSDLAVLKVDAKNLVPAEFASSDDVQVGQSVVAIGDPLGTELRGTMTDGIICGINRDVQVGDRSMTLIQTNAALNSGNSGGPLVSLTGQVIGINTMKLRSNYNNVEGIGFAIPISAAAPIIDELLEKGYVSGRPAFGFTVETLSLQMRLFYNLPGALYIRSVEERSDAFTQGVRVGDVIVAIDGEEVASRDEFNTIKNRFSAGDTVTLTLFRKGAEFDVDVELMDRADMD